MRGKKKDWKTEKRDVCTVYSLAVEGIEKVMEGANGIRQMSIYSRVLTVQPLYLSCCCTSVYLLNVKQWWTVWENGDFSEQTFNSQLWGHSLFWDAQLLDITRSFFIKRPAWKTVLLPHQIIFSPSKMISSVQQLVSPLLWLDVWHTLKHAALSSMNIFPCI